MCVCLCVCVCVCVYFANELERHTHTLHAHTLAYTHTHMLARTHTHTHTNTHTHTHTQETCRWGGERWVGERNRICIIFLCVCQCLCMWSCVCVKMMLVYFGSCSVFLCIYTNFHHWTCISVLCPLILHEYFSDADLTIQMWCTMTMKEKGWFVSAALPSITATPSMPQMALMLCTHGHLLSTLVLQPGLALDTTCVYR